MPHPEPSSLAEALSRDDELQGWREWLDGRVLPRLDVWRVDALVVGNLTAALHAHLKGRPACVLPQSMRLRIGEHALLHPSLIVTDDPRDLQADDEVRHPLLVAEVGLQRRALLDAAGRFAAYRRIATLREYLLIDPDTRRVEVWRRNERGNFELFDPSGEMALTLASVGLVMPLGELFDGVDEGADEGADSGPASSPA